MSQKVVSERVEHNGVEMNWNCWMISFRECLQHLQERHRVDYRQTTSNKQLKFVEAYSRSGLLSQRSAKSENNSQGDSFLQPHQSISTAGHSTLMSVSIALSNALLGLILTPSPITVACCVGLAVEEAVDSTEGDVRAVEGAMVVARPGLAILVDASIPLDTVAVFVTQLTAAATVDGHDSKRQSAPRVKSFHPATRMLMKSPQPLVMSLRTSPAIFTQFVQISNADVVECVLCGIRYEDIRKGLKDIKRRYEPVVYLARKICD